MKFTFASLVLLLSVSPFTAAHPLEHAKDEGVASLYSPSTILKRSQTPSASASASTLAATTGGGSPPGSPTADPNPPQPTADCSANSGGVGCTSYTEENPPSEEETKQLLTKLDNYKSDDPSTYSSLVSDIIQSYLVHPPSPDKAVYYTSDGKAAANSLNDKAGMENVGSAYNGDNNAFPFNTETRPFSMMSDTQKTAWYKATGRAFARVTAGTTYIISDAADVTNPKTTFERIGQPAIFASDEFQELSSNGMVQQIVQVSSRVALESAAKGQALKPSMGKVIPKRA